MSHLEASTPPRKPQRLGLPREHRREAAYRRLYPVTWWTTLLAPIVVSGAVLVGIWTVRGWPAVVGVVGLALTSLFFGKFIILGGTNNSHVLLTSEELVVMVVLMDVMTACWFVFHLGFMTRLPFFGPRFALLIEDGENLLAAHPWIRRLAFLGLVVFVMIPFAMTGSVGGGIFSRLLGMNRHAALAAITIGSVLGAGLMYVGGATLDAHGGRDNPIWTIGGALVLAAIILFLNYRYAQVKARLRQRNQTPAA